MAVSLDWKFTVTLPELARMLDLSIKDTRRAAEGCLATNSVDVYSIDMVQQRFNLDDHQLLTMFRAMNA